MEFVQEVARLGSNVAIVLIMFWFLHAHVVALRQLCMSVGLWLQKIDAASVPRGDARHVTFSVSVTFGQVQGAASPVVQHVSVDGVSVVSPSDAGEVL